MVTSTSQRTLGRHLARELTPDEINAVAGGTRHEVQVPTNVGPNGDTRTQFEED